MIDAIVTLLCTGCRVEARSNPFLNVIYVRVPHRDCPLHGVGAILGHLENPDAAWTDIGGEA